MRRLRLPALVLATALAAAPIAAAQSPAPQSPAPLRQGFDIRVGAAPAPVRIGDAERLVYELQLSNFAGAPLEVLRIEARDADTGRTVADLEGEALGSALGGPATVGPNAFVLAHLEIVTDGTPPRRLTHRVTFASPEGGPDRVRTVVENGQVQVETRALPVLGPPLRGGPWVAVYQPEMPRGHRRVAYAVDGRVRVPGRFAVDWIRVDENGAKGREGDRALTADFSFGAEVLAVADGIVVATRDGVPDPADLDARSRPALQDAAGNYVALDIGEGRYAFYEHLSPGLRVRPGDRVRRGQMIGALGFTGQASGPHLHFHVSDGVEPLTAEGLPYLLSGYRTIGRYASIEAFSRGGPWPAETGPEGPAFPAHNAVVMFD